MEFGLALRNEYHDIYALMLPKVDLEICLVHYWPLHSSTRPFYDSKTTNSSAV